MSKGFETSISELIETATSIKSQPDPTQDLWSVVVSNFEPSGVISHIFCEPVEKMIEHYIRNQSEEDKRSIWSDTEAGMMDEQHEDYETDIQSIEMDLEVALFEGFMEQAHKTSTE